MSETPVPNRASEATEAGAAEEPVVSASAASIRPVDDPDAHPPIRILGLRLRGVRRDYVVNFTDDSDVGRDLSLIVGEIATGKTTVLDFIDYCLGASSHPTHTEITDNARAAQLAIEILERPSDNNDDNGQQHNQRHDDEQSEDRDGGEQVRAGAHLARYVIERPVGGANATVMLFRGDHNRLDNSWYRRLTMTPADADSLSQFLLRACGLDGLRVRQSPSKQDSSTSILSFRDLMPLTFLAHTRIGSNDLVYEKNPHRTIKLRQVVDYLFDVSDQAFSDIATRIEELRNSYREAQSGLNTLRSFLLETGVRSEDDLRDAASRARARRAIATEELTQISQSLAASTEFAATTRTAYNNAAQVARELSAQIRERDTLLGRLSTLRSQYADDLHKIDLLAETRQLFDALSVTVCPACQNALAEPVTIADGDCTLCHQPVIAALSPHPDDRNTVDLSRERRNLRKRLRELGVLTDEIAVEVAELNASLLQAQQALEQAQRNLDASTSAAVAPFITQRDQLTATIAGIDTELGTLENHHRMQRQMLEREREAERIGAALTAARERRKVLEQSQRDRDAVLAQLSGRFGELLAAFHFPKLSEPFIDSSLIPHARGSRYDQLGSAGAMTLIALAWELAIFELSVEQGRSHPGFLMIDSPQKGLRQVSDGSTVSSDIASDAGSIVDRVYAHIARWLAAHPGRAQIIIVDNEPPASVNENDVAVRYSGDPADPPYGLIEDAVD